jgi:pantetheine-phosphate adenylyltransferase
MKNTTRIAIFPGSFDPFTIGHQQIVEHAIEIFDEVIIAIGQSATKVPMLETQVRLEALRETFASSPSVKAEAFTGLVVEFARQKAASYLIRGLRNETDLAFELPMAHTNRCLAPDIQTVFLPTSPERAFISSTLVREIAKHQGEFSAFVPEAFARRMKARIS